MFLLYISSGDRVSGSNTSFRIDLSRNIQNVKYISLVYCKIANNTGLSVDDNLMLDVDVISKKVLSSNPISRIHTFIIPIEIDSTNASIIFSENRHFQQLVNNEQVNITELNITLSHADGSALSLTDEFSFVLRLE